MIRNDDLTHRAFRLTLSGWIEQKVQIILIILRSVDKITFKYFIHILFTGKVKRL